jgi:hypothetical protein
MEARACRNYVTWQQRERESQALQEQLDAAMDAATLSLCSGQGVLGENGVQEHSQTSRTDAVIDTSTFTFIERYSSRREIEVLVVTVSDKPLDHGTLTQMVIELV